MKLGDKIKLTGVSHSRTIVTFTIKKEPRRGHKKYRITWTQSKGDYREEWVENFEDAKAFPKKWEENEKAKNGSKAFERQLTWLSEKQLREAEGCIQRLPDRIILDDAFVFSIKHKVLN